MNKDVTAKLLSKDSVSGLLDNCTHRHIENLVRSGRMPAPIYIGRLPRWRLSDLVEWMDNDCPVVDEDMYRTWLRKQDS